MDFLKYPLTFYWLGIDGCLSPSEVRGGTPSQYSYFIFLYYAISFRGEYCNTLKRSFIVSEVQGLKANYQLHKNSTCNVRTNYPIYTL